MKKTEMKKCRRCGKMYIWESGGFVMSPKDFADGGMCEICRKLAMIKKS